MRRSVLAAFLLTCLAWGIISVGLSLMSALFNAAHAYTKPADGWIEITDELRYSKGRIRSLTLYLNETHDQLDAVNDVVREMKKKKGCR